MKIKLLDRLLLWRMSEPKWLEFWTKIKEEAEESESIHYWLCDRSDTFGSSWRKRKKMLILRMARLWLAHQKDEWKSVFGEGGFILLFHIQTLEVSPAQKLEIRMTFVNDMIAHCAGGRRWTLATSPNGNSGNKS